MRRLRACRPWKPRGSPRATAAWRPARLALRRGPRGRTDIASYPPPPPPRFRRTAPPAACLRGPAGEGAAQWRSCACLWRGDDAPCGKIDARKINSLSLAAACAPHNTTHTRAAARWEVGGRGREGSHKDGAEVVGPARVVAWVGTKEGRERELGPARARAPLSRSYMVQAGWQPPWLRHGGEKDRAGVPEGGGEDFDGARPLQQGARCATSARRDRALRRARSVAAQWALGAVVQVALLCTAPRESLRPARCACGTVICEAFLGRQARRRESLRSAEKCADGWDDDGNAAAREPIKRRKEVRGPLGRWWGRGGGRATPPRSPQEDWRDAA